ncbi:hypothetical protein VNO78_06208 [Psophocarpus tetragonolobus]|uniref:Uncharacterized protein n=1 Tax=Psophocarpus tetragonolobus TaxID=3891 RepID=A0AAN9STW2_PSOTE
MDAAATVISNQSKKENVPPPCNSDSNNKIKIMTKTKIPIPHIISTSFKTTMKRSKRISKRVPLADITNFFNHSASCLSHHQQYGLPVFPRRPHRSSNTLRMGFR